MENDRNSDKREAGSAAGSPVPDRTGNGEEAARARQRRTDAAEERIVRRITKIERLVEELKLETDSLRDNEARDADHWSRETVGRVAFELPLDLVVVASTTLIPFLGSRELENELQRVLEECEGVPPPEIMRQILGTMTDCIDEITAAVRLVSMSDEGQSVQ